MKQMSERVKSEFDRLQNEYEIPFEIEFQVKTLLNLQEEYDEVEKGSNTTKTRETLLYMIERLQSNIRFKKKTTPTFSPMYVDVFTKEGYVKLVKVVVYINDEIYTIQGRAFETFKDYASAIRSIAIDKLAIIHIDSRGMGLGLLEELKKYDDIHIKELKINKNYCM